MLLNERRLDPEVLAHTHQESGNVANSMYLDVHITKISWKFLSSLVLQI